MDITIDKGSVLGGQYRLDGVLGKGGSGVTYAATHLPSGSAVAVKQFRLEQAQDWKAVDMFHREARVLSYLSHPSIPKYLGTFEDDTNGRKSFFLVQELAPGRTLDALVSSGWRATEEQARRIAEALLDVLIYLQQMHPPVFHRDIKPKNVLLADDGLVSVVDFGSVRDSYRNTLTQGNTVVGTFGYMAPEQFRGVATRATDLFGLGTTILFMLTARHPSELPHRKLVIAVRRVAGVSDSFASWLERVVEPDAEARLASAREARELLHGRRAVGSSRRLVWLLAAGGVTVAAALAGTAVFVHSIASRPTPGLSNQESPAATLSPASPPLAALQLEPVRVLSGHWSAVFDLAFTAGGSQLVSGSFDQTVKLWDVNSGAVLRSFAGHSGPIGGVAISPDGTMLASSGDTTIRLWNLADGSLLRTLAGHGARTTRVLFSPDGKRVVSGGFDGTVRVWDASTGGAVQTIEHGKRVLALAITADGLRVLSAGDLHDVKMWELQSGKLLREFRGHSATIGTLAMSPDGSTFASAGDDKTIRIWTMATGAPMFVLAAGDGEVWDAAFSRDGKTLASVGQDGMVRLWDVYTGKLQRMFASDSKGSLKLAFSPDGKTLATGGGGNTVKLWNTTFLKHAPPPLATARPRPPAPAADINGRDDTAMIERGRYLLEWNDSAGEPLAETARLASRAKELNSRNARAHALQGRVLNAQAYLRGSEYSLEGLAKAVESLDRAIEIDPNLVEAHVTRAYTYIHQKDLEHAAASAERAAALEPGSPRVQMLFADLAQKQGSVDDAYERAMNVVTLDSPDPLRASAYSVLAWALQKRKDYESADICMRSIIVLSPESAWSKINYASFLNRRGRHDDGIHWAKASLEQMNFGMGHKILAEAYAGKGWELYAIRADDPAAGEWFDKALKESSASEFVHYCKAMYLRAVALRKKDAGMMEESRTELERALQLKPDYEKAKTALAEHARVAAAVE